MDSVAEQPIIFPQSMYLDFFIVQDKDKTQETKKRLNQKPLYRHRSKEQSAR